MALLTAIPFGIAAAVILGNAYHSKATGERRWHVAAPLAFAACALFALAFLLKCVSQSPCILLPALRAGLFVALLLSAVTVHLCRVCANLAAAVAKGENVSPTPTSAECLGTHCTRWPVT